MLARAFFLAMALAVLALVQLPSFATADVVSVTPDVESCSTVSKQNRRKVGARRVVTQTAECPVGSVITDFECLNSNTGSFSSRPPVLVQEGDRMKLICQVKRKKTLRRTVTVTAVVRCQEDCRLSDPGQVCTERSDTADVTLRPTFETPVRVECEANELRLYDDNCSFSGTPDPDFVNGAFNVKTRKVVDPQEETCFFSLIEGSFRTTISASITCMERKCTLGAEPEPTNLVLV